MSGRREGERDRPGKNQPHVAIWMALVLLMGIGAACVPRISIENQSARQLHATAESALRNKDYPEAMRYYEMYLRRYPEGAYTTAVMMRIAEIQMAESRYQAARKSYQRLIDRFPDSSLVSDAAVGVLASFYKARQYKDVIRYADDMLKKVEGPDDVRQVYGLLGDAYMALDSPINAVYYYSISGRYARYPSDEKRGKIDAALSQLSAAEIEVLLKRIKEDDPVRGALLYQLAVAQMAENRKEEAGRTVSEFLQKYPDHRKAGDARTLLEEYETLPLASRHTIGCLLPLSGAYRIYGNRALRGVELAMSRSSGIHLVIRDTGSDPQLGLMAVNDLLDVAEPSAIIGPIITAETVAPEAQGARIPIITLTQKEGIPALGQFVFRNFITPRMQVTALISHAARQMGRYRFGVLYPNEKYGVTFLELFQEEAVRMGGSVVSTAGYDIDQTDFRDAIRALRQGYGSGGNGGFDALFIPDAPRKTGLILPQLAYYDLRTQLLGTNLWHSDQLLRMAGKFAEGAVFPTGFFPDSQSPHVVEFVTAFRDTYGEPPGFIEAIAYDTARLLIDLLSRPDIRYKSALQEQLANLRDFPGVTGPTGFDATGEVRKDLYLLEIRNGEFVEIGQAGVALAGQAEAE